MRVRDRLSRLGDSDTVSEYKSGFDIVDDEYRTIFSVQLMDDGITLSITGGMTHKAGGKLMDDRFVIVPRFANNVELVKVPYTEFGKEVLYDE